VFFTLLAEKLAENESALASGSPFLRKPNYPSRCNAMSRPFSSLVVAGAQRGRGRFTTFENSQLQQNKSNPATSMRAPKIPHA
jgi:hypothetical protein